MNCLKSKEPNPYKIYYYLYRRIESDVSKAGWFSRLLFNWIKPLLRLGNKRPLQFEDLPPLAYYIIILFVRPSDSAEGLKSSFSKAWEKQSKKKKYYLYTTNTKIGHL